MHTLSSHQHPLPECYIVSHNWWPYIAPSLSFVQSSRFCYSLNHTGYHLTDVSGSDRLSKGWYCSLLPYSPGGFHFPHSWGPCPPLGFFIPSLNSSLPLPCPLILRILLRDFLSSFFPLILRRLTFKWTAKFYFLLVSGKFYLPLESWGRCSS